MHVLHMEEASLSWIINIATVAHLPSSVIILPKRQFVWGGGDPSLPVFTEVRGTAKKQDDQNALIKKGGLEDDEARAVRSEWDGRNRMRKSGNGKLDDQFLFSIHFDLRDCTVSVSCYLGYLLNI